MNGTLPVAELQKAGNKGPLERAISGIRAGGGTAMYPPMVKAFEMLHEAKASLKHCIILTDGESQPGDFEGITQKMVENRITVSTVAAGDQIRLHALFLTVRAPGKRIGLVRAALPVV